jgi:hypothetical protein
MQTAREGSEVLLKAPRAGGFQSTITLAACLAAVVRQAALHQGVVRAAVHPADPLTTLHQAAVHRVADRQATDLLPMLRPGVEDGVADIRPASVSRRRFCPASTTLLKRWRFHLRQ